MTAVVENAAFLERLLSDRSPAPSPPGLPRPPSDQHLARILREAGLEAFHPPSPAPSHSSGHVTPPDGFRSGSAFGGQPGGAGLGLDDELSQLGARLGGLDLDRSPGSEDEMMMRMQRDELLARESQLRSYHSQLSSLSSKTSLDGYAGFPTDGPLPRNAFTPPYTEADLQSAAGDGQRQPFHNQSFSRRSAFFHRDLPNVTPPDGYVCKLCFVPGHFMKHCSLYREKPRFEYRKGFSDVPPENYLCKLCFIPGHFMKNCSLYRERNPQPQAVYGRPQGAVGGLAGAPPGLYPPGARGASPMRGGMQQPGVRKPFGTVPPDGYVCKICSVPGHWIQQCPLRHIQPPPHQHYQPYGHQHFQAQAQYPQAMAMAYDSQYQQRY